MNKNTAFVSSDEEIIYIGNENTVREISTSGKILRTVRIINRRMDETSFSPSDGSEEFIISYKKRCVRQGQNTLLRLQTEKHGAERGWGG